MPRAFLVVLDSVGIGGAPDAGGYFNGDLPDTGANTLGHIAAACAAGKAEEGRSGPLHLPNLDALGLGAALRLASGARGAGLDALPEGLWGAAEEVSKGKDTPSGHWELAGTAGPGRSTPNQACPDETWPRSTRAGDLTHPRQRTRHDRDHAPALGGAPRRPAGRSHTIHQASVQSVAHRGKPRPRPAATLSSAAPMLHRRRSRVHARALTGTPAPNSRTVKRHDYAIAPPVRPARHQDAARNIQSARSATSSPVAASTADKPSRAT